MEQQSAADLSGPRRRVSIESATLSRYSSRHAANPWLTNKDGKQEAKKDDDEREAEAHAILREDRWCAGPTRAGEVFSLTRGPEGCQEGGGA